MHWEEVRSKKEKKMRNGFQDTKKAPKTGGGRGSPLLQTMVSMGIAEVKGE